MARQLNKALVIIALGINKYVQTSEHSGFSKTLT